MQRVERARFASATTVAHTDRGQGGFGSTGR
jgi:dUTPase